MYNNEFYHMIESVMVGPHAGATNGGNISCWDNLLPVFLNDAIT